MEYNMDTIHIFTYGTLKTGFPNHHYLTNLEKKLYNESLPASTFVTTGVTKEEYPLIVATNCGIPFVLDKPGTGKKVHGEVFNVNKPMLMMLDELETHPTAYKRREIDISTNDGSLMKCWTYLFPNFKELVLENTFLDTYVSSMYVPKADRPPGLDPYSQIQN